MLCFKDMTFCSAAGVTCDPTGCHRYLSRSLRSQAERWSKKITDDGLLVAWSDYSETCEDFRALAAQKEEGDVR